MLSSYNFKTIKKSVNISNIDIVYIWTDPHDSIYFSLKTVEKFFNKIRTIFIIVNDIELEKDKLTKWLINKIQYITVPDIIPQELMPSTDIKIIESFIWNIKNISKYSIYLRSDTFIGNYITDDILFHDDIIPLLFYKQLKKNDMHQTPTTQYFINKFN